MPDTPSPLAGRRLLLGVSGGIAAYKAAELLRQLQGVGAEVRVAMTAAAQEFVAPLTFQALSGAAVHTELLDPHAEAAMGHIELARWAEAVLVAPASADVMARLAHGLANDLLSTLCLASRAPLYLAPAMNPAMWANPATQANAQCLRERGIGLLGPAYGAQACGEQGLGRMREPAELVADLCAVLQPSGPLAGCRFLITAGPTREPIDPVRYLSNRSSGRMGFAIAEAAARVGATVSLVAGPVSLATPTGVTRIDVATAREMYAAVMEHLTGQDVFVGVAAVADYALANPPRQKLKKTAETLQLTLTRNPDILAAVAATPHAPFTVGFAAETEDLAVHAQAKLYNKGLDMICANAVGPDLAFGREDNRLEVYWPGGGQTLEKAPKIRLASQLLDLIAQRLQAKTQAKRSTAPHDQA